MTEPKTKLTGLDVNKFLNAIPDEKRRQDCYAVLEILCQATGAEPKMWGDSIVGFGEYHYVYASGREGDWPVVGFSPRKQNLTLYFSHGFEHYPDLMARMGKYKTGKGCLYIKRMEDIDPGALRELAERTTKDMA